MVDGLAEPFAPTEPPTGVLIVLGNRGAEDAFTHDSVTIGFDLAALQANYGAAGLPENRDRMDRFFRHEFVHLLQKAWASDHPLPMATPLQSALAEIWADGMGNYQSLSERWLSRDSADRLVADLSWGRFDRKWGALPAALWLEAEPGPPTETLRGFVAAGPAGVWTLADRHLAPSLRPVLREARMADSLCASH
jgi:hypothetical protein